MRRPRRAALWSGLIALAALYAGLWLGRRELEIVRPTANLQYFFYGAGPCTVSDSLLYWTFWPAYRTSLAVQDLGGDRSEVHWSGRNGGTGYEHLCTAGRRLGV